MKLIHAALAGALFCLPATGYAATVTYSDLPTFQAATSVLTTDDFESGDWQPNFSNKNGLTTLGVTWDSPEDLQSTSVSPLSGASAISSIDTSFDDEINASFGAGVTAAGGFIYGFQNATITMTAFDALDNVLGSTSVVTPNAYSFLGITTMTDISRVQFLVTNVNGGDDFLLDDFVFGSANNVPPVPLPAGGWLMMTGMIALLGAARARRRRN